MTELTESRVLEITSTSGAVDDYVLGGNNGDFRTFGAVYLDTETFYYVRTDGANYEEAVGTYNGSADTITPGTVLRSSNAGARVDWPAGGTSDIFVVTPGDKVPYVNAAGSGIIIPGISPVDGDILVFDIGTSRWVSQGLSPSNADLLVFDSATSRWVPSGPVLNKGELFGLGLTNRAAQPLDDIVIAAGQCYGIANSGADATIVLATIIKQIDATWVAGNDAGGRSSSVLLSADTWYHVLAILVGGVADVGFDTSIVAANLITDHAATHYRRLGSVLTDVSSNIIAFFQADDVFLWKSPPLDINVANQGTTGISRVLSSPPGVRLLVIVNSSIDHSTSNVTVNFQSGGANDEAPSRTIAPLGHTAGLHAGTTNFRDQSNSLLLTNTNSVISSRSTASATSVFLVTVGWIDPRGRVS